MINKDFNSFKKNKNEFNNSEDKNSFLDDSKNSDINVQSVLSGIDDLNQESNKMSVSKSRKNLKYSKSKNNKCETPKKKGKNF